MRKKATERLQGLISPYWKYLGKLVKSQFKKKQSVNNEDGN